MCIIGCAPFRAGNNFFQEVDNGIEISATKYKVKTRIVDISFDEKELTKIITTLLSPIEDYKYQGLLLYIRDPQIWDTNSSNEIIDNFKKSVKSYNLYSKVNIRFQIKSVKGEQKIQLIAAYSRMNNIKSYLCGNDNWRAFPYWFVTRTLNEFNPESFDDSITIIEATKLEDIQNITDILQNGKSPCIFCSKELYQEAKTYFKNIFPEYTWCIR